MRARGAGASVSSLKMLVIQAPGQQLERMRLDAPAVVRDRDVDGEMERAIRAIQLLAAGPNRLIECQHAVRPVAGLGLVVTDAFPSASLDANPVHSTAMNDSSSISARSRSTSVSGPVATARGPAGIRSSPEPRG